MSSGSVSRKEAPLSVDMSGGHFTALAKDKSQHKIAGVADVTLKFGDDGSAQYQSLLAAGAFAEFSRQNIFEESDGLLASH